jgi:hypothetical protein
MVEPVVVLVTGAVLVTATGGVMSIGIGIFLVTAGAILAFGVRDRSGALDLSAVGVIIMLAGACGIWLSYRITNKRRRVESHLIDPAVEEKYRALHEDTPSEYEASLNASYPRTESLPHSQSQNRRVRKTDRRNGTSTWIRQLAGCLWRFPTVASLHGPGHRPRRHRLLR